MGHEQARIDGTVLAAIRRIADSPGDAVPHLAAWLAEDLHGVRYGAVFGPDGNRLGGNILAMPTGLQADGRAHRAEVGPIGRDRDGDGPEVVRGVAERLPDGGLLALGYDIDEVDEVQGIILRALGLGMVPAVLLSLVGGTLLAQRGERRIAAVHEALGRIMQGHLQERLPTRGTAGELDKVTAAVNGMLDRIEQLVEEIRGVGDSIAHDLRTPLTRVRTRLERSRDEAVTREEFQAAADRAIASVDQALAVVSAVLRIGEIEHGQRRAAFAPVDLAGLLRDAAELYEPVAEEKGVALRLRLAAGSTVPGDRDLLLEAVGNLLDNAVKFTPAGTDVTLSLYGGPNGACIRVHGEPHNGGQRPRAEPGRRGRLAAWLPPADRRQRGRLRRRDRLLSRRRAGPGAGGPAFDAGRPAGPGKLTAGPPAYIGISQSPVQRGPTQHGARCLLSTSRRGPPCLPTHRPPIEC